MLMNETSHASARAIFVRICWNMWLQIFGASAITVASTLTARAFFSASNDRTRSEDFDAADSADGFVRVRKMMSDIAFAHRAEKRIRNRVRKNIRI